MSCCTSHRCVRIRTKVHDLSVHTTVSLTILTENCAGANNHLIYKVISSRKGCKLQAVNKFFLEVTPVVFIKETMVTLTQGKSSLDNVLHFVVGIGTIVVNYLLLDQTINV